MASLWIGLVVSISSWFLAGGLVELGMSAWQGVACVFVGNAIVLLPMVLLGHAGVKYGCPFPVLARSSFGVRGAILPAVLRGLVAAGWFGINSWLGGLAIHQMLQTLTGGGLGGGAVVGWLGITASQAWCFLAFWALQVAILLKGMEGIRLLEKYSAPILIALTAALVGWAVNAAGGFGPMLSTPSQFGPGMPRAGQFYQVFWPALGAQLGYWATLALNIPDFSRYAKSQRAQLVGQAFGLPVFMAAFTFAGLAVTSATVVLFGTAVSDPIALLSRVEGVWGIAAALVGLVLATITTNLAANCVAPANAFVAAAPGRFTFEGGALLTSVLGLLVKPWRLIANTSNFFNWLVGYSVVLGPIAGIMLFDYYCVRHRQLDLDALYSDSPTAAYWYRRGWNPAALLALAAGAAPTLPGLLHTLLGTPVPRIFVQLYTAAWFVGFFAAGLVYWALMSRPFWLRPQEALVGTAA
ncbi:hypothetical protein COHA_006112 [Chlorella ohadii]|uniref:Nitrate reductase n=1 Tax=Chlorella ohadii TaxID=2649997 RepID=A0AAD5DQV8_9CHLO|nr:hypothetical protein COHA_006112 [Chlorella ohadii]